MIRKSEMKVYRSSSKIKKLKSAMLGGKSVDIKCRLSLEHMSLSVGICFLVVVASLVQCIGATENEIVQAPVFVEQPSSSSSIVVRGRTKFLQCKAKATPQAQYKWIKDGEPLSDFKDAVFYKISNAARNDSGSYQCLAHNIAGTIFSEKSEVIVAYMEGFKNMREEVFHVKSGRNVILNLTAIDSVPVPSVVWETKKGQIKNGIKHFVTSKNQLVILAVDEEDNGSAYRAKATNTQIGREEISAYTYLNVSGDSYSEVGPEIVVPLEDVKAVKGESIEFECIANARPLHEVETHWFKDDVPIEETDIVYALEWWNRTLNLLSVESSYKGQYECRVQMKTGGYKVESSKANLNVLEPPTFKSSSQIEIDAEYFSKLEIPCEVAGHPEPYVTWFRNSEAIDLSINIYRKRNDNTLVIEKVGLDDSGIFQCLASNEAGEKSSYAWIKVKNVKADIARTKVQILLRNSNNYAKKFVRDKRLAQPRIILGDFSSSSNELTVQDSSSPVMEVFPQNMTSLDGKDVTFTCQALGAPLPNVTWIFNDSTMLEPSSRFQIFSNGDLVISNIQEKDSGSYKCVRSNEAGSVSGEAFLGVLVRTHITKPPSDTIVLLGLTASLQCKVSSDQNVNYTIQWFREKQPDPIRNNQRIVIKEDGTLEISAVRASDVGQYICIVSSFAGNETRSAKLSVVELPFAPSNVQAKRMAEPNQRTVVITWTAGFDGNSPILKYIVQRREVSEIEISGPLPDNLQNWITEISNITATQKSVQIKNLKAATSYQFRVSAVNRVGEGYPSEPTQTISLPHESPSGPPVSFMGSARSSSEIIAQWQPPLEEHRNGQILGYILRYKLSGYKESPWTYTNISNEAQRNYLIQDLITWKDYIVQIAAFNNMGTGVYTEGARIKTKEGIPEAPPSDVKVKVVNSTAVLVTWKPPNPQQINGINQGYKIQAIRYATESNGEKDNEVETLKVPPNLINPLEEQNCTLGSLKKFTAYNITVLCFTHPGDGVASHPIPIVTHEDTPEEVSTLQFIGVSDRELTIKWSEPVEKNGVITGYQVKYKIKDSPDTKAINLTAHDSSLHVSQLKALTHYNFEVVAWTSKGAGQPKTAVIQSGIEPVLPEPPTTLALSNIEAFSVVIQFNPGFDGNSSITKWIVEAKTVRNDLWTKIFDVSDPEASTLTVTGLSPYSQYKLRIIARNIVGESQPSEPTKDFQTLQAKPKHAPGNVTVRAMSSSELRVRWIPLQQTEWFGNPKGYNISYRLKEDSPTDLNEPVNVLIEDSTSNSYVLKSLEEWSLYEIVVSACNEVGQSVESPSALERTREAVPSSGPLQVEANATSSTTIVVKWSNVPKKAQNGQIEGYKVFYGAPGTGNVPVLQKTIPNNKTFTTTLTELKKFVVYHIQVLAYTRLGDGSLSMPPIRTQTFEDTPGIPSNVSFPDVSFTTARIIWDVPEESNGEILAYKVTYSLNESNKLDFSREFSPLDRTYRASNLLPEHFYRFTVTAQTRIGWGAQTANVLVFTTNNRELPQSPSVPQISRSQIQSQQITFNWTPGRDGFGPLRYYTVQLRENEGNWITLPERIDPSSNSYTTLNLKPYTLYQFRIRAINDLGASPYSKESVDVRTLPAAPAFPVTGLKVVPITTSSVRLEWTPLKKNLWNGDSDGESGYRVVYQPIDDFGSKILADVPKLDVMGIDQKGAILKDLTQDQNYEIVVFPFNSQGLGPPSSPPVAVYVGEAVPTGEPQDFEGAAVSSTEVRLKWKAPNHAAQNGDLLGYKIFYLITDSPQPLEDGFKLEEEIEVVPASSNSHSLVFLDKYTEYQIQMLAFNPAGDGPRSRKITIRTLQGLPSAPRNLTFSDITMNSLKVSWDPPKYRNGDIVGYIVTYETTEDNEKFSKQVKQKVTTTDLVFHNLEEEVAYTFTVRAQTTDYGPAAAGNITTGPQDGSPISPKELTLSKNVAYIDLHWLNGPSGKGPIIGYYFESKKRDDTKWQVVAKSNHGPIQDFTVSFQTLLPSTVYTFRVSSYNRFGISFPIYSEEPVLTPSKLYLEYGYLQQTPFYRQPWFSMSVACVGTIMIIMITAVLCVKSKSYKYKQEAQKTLEESMAMSIDERQELALELYRSRHGLSSTTALNPTGTIGRNKNGTTNKKSTSSSAALGKSPPRPSPASVAYHSDEESLKCYDENPDDSSVTEKPSEVSSSDSQQSESENESVRSDGTSFVNHYANINNTLRQSWKRQKPMRNYSSYTDSEPEGSTQMNLNGGQIIMNNMARSRAPLPGFSSFV